MLLIGSAVLFELAAHRVSANPISVSLVTKQYHPASDWSPKHTGAIWRTTKHPAPLLSLCPHYRRPNVPGSAAMYHSTPLSYFQCSQPQLETFLIFFVVVVSFCLVVFWGCQVDWSAATRVCRGGTSSDPHAAFFVKTFCYYLKSVWPPSKKIHWRTGCGYFKIIIFIQVVKDFDSNRCWVLL